MKTILFAMKWSSLIVTNKKIIHELELKKFGKIDSRSKIGGQLLAIEKMVSTAQSKSTLAVSVFIFNFFYIFDENYVCCDRIKRDVRETVVEKHLFKTKYVEMIFYLA